MDALTPRTVERGTSLVELTIATAVLVLLVASLTPALLARNTYALRAGVKSFAAFIADARAVAASSGQGATVAVAGDGTGGFVAQLLPYRPAPDASFASAPVRTLRAHLVLRAATLGEADRFSVFISSSGNASAATWSPGDGQIADEPACTGTIALAFANGTQSETHQIGCADASFR